MQLATTEQFDAFVSAQVQHEMKIQRLRNELAIVMEIKRAHESVAPLDGPKKMQLKRKVDEIQARFLRENTRVDY